MSGVYPASEQEPRPSSIPEVPTGTRALHPFLWALLLTGLATAADQLAAPLLYSSSPLWATAACLLLVWRRGQASSQPSRFPFSLARLSAFFGLHLILIFAARTLQPALQSAVGSVALLGTLIALCKLSVLVPSIFLLPISEWKGTWRNYRAEAIAGILVLFTFFPGRVIEALWPWYGQALGRFVFGLSRVFVSGIGYVGNLDPTLTGPDLNVTIILACSGINGIQLFDYLFGAIAVLDWNRLRKDRLLAGYFWGLFAMLLGNALRITSLVVLGNRGFADAVARYHISAGWIFFSLVFLIYLSITYRWMLARRGPAVQM